MSGYKILYIKYLKYLKYLKYQKMEGYWVQTRSDSIYSIWAGTPKHDTIRAGFEAAKSDKTTWKISFCTKTSVEDKVGTFFRFLRKDNKWGEERENEIRTMRPDLFLESSDDKKTLWIHIPIMTNVMEEVLTEEEFEKKYC